MSRRESHEHGVRQITGVISGSLCPTPTTRKNSRATLASESVEFDIHSSPARTTCCGDGCKERRREMATRSMVEALEGRWHLSATASATMSQGAVLVSG